MRTRSPGFAVYGSGGTSDVRASSQAPTARVCGACAAAPGLRYAAPPVLTPADLAPAWHITPANGFETVLRPIAFVDVLVDSVLFRIRETRLTAPTVRVPRRLALLPFTRRR